MSRDRFGDSCGRPRVSRLREGGEAADSETLEEIGVENAKIFHRNGGTNFAVIPCLNDSELGMDVIETVVRRELGGWIRDPD